jgi:hypothetical protein
MERFKLDPWSVGSDRAFKPRVLLLKRNVYVRASLCSLATLITSLAEYFIWDRVFRNSVCVALITLEYFRWNDCHIIRLLFQIRMSLAINLGTFYQLI